MSNEPSKPGETKSLPVEIRLLIAFALMGLVVFGTPYFYKLLGIKVPEKTEKTEQTQQAAPASPSTPTAALATPAQKAAMTPPSAGSVAAPAEESVTVDTDVYHIVFSNRGATVKSWTLKKFKDHAGKPLELVNLAAIPKVGKPMEYEFRGNKPSFDLNQALFRARESNDGLNVDFEFSANGATAKKSFVFQRDSYLLQVTSEAGSSGQPLPHLLVWRGGFGDLAVHSPSSQENAVRYENASNKVEHDNAKTAKNGPVSKDGNFAWVGIEDQYLAAVFLPVESAPLQSTIFDDQVKTPFDTSEEAFVGVGVGGDAVNRLSLYVGPKDVETLRKVNPKLEPIVDFGFWGLIAKPLFQSLRWLNENWFHNYGWSIIVATIIINMVLFPLKLANLKSMRKMQHLQPEIAKINEKYKALPLRDPRQADKNAEMMALYSKAGTNPMAGCIPMLIQMPFLFAFYKVLSISIALRGASWMWVDDLSQPEQLAIRVLPIVLVITGFVMQKMTPMTTVDPAQQKTMMLMPLMMGFLFYQASSGLVLYWLTGNLVGIAQQWLLNKAMPQPAAPVPATKDVKKTNNRK